MIDPIYYDFNRDMEQVAIFLRAEADLVADTLQVRIAKMLASGMSPAAVKAALVADLRTGGPLFSGFTQTFRRAASPMIDNTAQGAIAERSAEEDRWEWVTTSADPCDDCEPRHGQVKTYKAWVDAGLPRSGFSACGDHCKCVLLPADSTGTTVGVGPVKIKTLAEMRADFQSRLETDPELQAKMGNYRSRMREGLLNTQRRL